MSLFFIVLIAASVFSRHSPHRFFPNLISTPKLLSTQGIPPGNYLKLLESPDATLRSSKQKTLSKILTLVRKKSSEEYISLSEEVEEWMEHDPSPRIVLDIANEWKTRRAASLARKRSKKEIASRASSAKALFDEIVADFNQKNLAVKNRKVSLSWKESFSNQLKLIDGLNSLSEQFGDDSASTRKLKILALKVLIQKNIEGVNRLIAPASRGDVSAVKTALSEGYSTETVSENMETALYVAAREGHFEVVKVMVEAGADVDHARDTGVTPLLAAAYMGHTKIAVFLIQHGADVSMGAFVEDERFDLPLGLARQKGDKVLEKEILKVSKETVIP